MPRCCQVWVVYLLIPTSNHNIHVYWNTDIQLFISWFLHQTTTREAWEQWEESLFISWFLHQTTTQYIQSLGNTCCLSLDSYIKPQLNLRVTSCGMCCLSLDSYIKPQQEGAAGHPPQGCLSLDSYIKPQPNISSPSVTPVVYLLIPTSNHNWTCA